MKNQLKILSIILILFVISSSVTQYANSTEITVPPTPAIAGLVTNSGTYKAPNYNSIPTLSGINGISTSTTGSTITIDGSGANPGNSSEIVQPTQQITKYSQETVISNFQKNNGWTDQTSPACGLTYNTTSFIQGNQSAQLNLFGNGTTCQFRSPTLSPTINIKNQVLVFWILTNDTLRFSDLRLQVTNDSFTHFTNYRLWGNSISSLNWIMPNMWSKVTLSLTASDTTNAPDYTAIKQIQFKIVDTGSNIAKHPIRVQLAGLGYYPIADYPIVSFTFDNNDITQYTQAMPALDIWHYPATAFVPTNFIGIDSSHMTLAQLKNLYFYHGWDISPKTKDNPTMTAGYSSSYLNSQIHDSKYYLLTNGMSTGSDITAYNHGAFNQTVLDIESKYEKAGRTIAEGCPNVACNGLSETYPPADWYRLRVLDILNTTSITSIENRLNLAYSNHDWVIIELHQVEPSNPLTSSEQILTSTFGTIVNYTHAKGFKVETISQVLNNFPNPITPNNCSGSTVANGINSTGYLNCITVSTGSTSGVTSINGVNGTMFIGSSGNGNLTYTNNTISKRITVNLGSNPVIINGSPQEITKGIKIDKLNDSSGIVSSIDTSKKITFLNSGMTTAVTTTIRNNATTSQGLNLPSTRETETIAIKPQLTTISPTNGNGTTDIAGRMQHVGSTMKAQVTGRMFIIAYGDVTNSVSGDGALLQLRWNSGSAPLNGAVLNGNTCGTQIKFVSASSTQVVPFTLVCEVNGLTLGTNYWVDIGLNAVTGGTAKLGEVRIDTWET